MSKIISFFILTICCMSLAYATNVTTAVCTPKIGDNPPKIAVTTCDSADDKTSCGPKQVCKAIPADEVTCTPDISYGCTTNVATAVCTPKVGENPPKIAVTTCDSADDTTSCGPKQVCKAIPADEVTCTPDISYGCTTK